MQSHDGCKLGIDFNPSYRCCRESAFYGASALRQVLISHFEAESSASKASTTAVGRVVREANEER